MSCPTSLGHLAVDDFSVRRSREGLFYRLTAFGELDIATAPILEREFRAAYPDLAAEMILVDLTQLSFMDSSGINLLMRLQTEQPGPYPCSAHVASLLSIPAFEQPEP